MAETTLHRLVHVFGQACGDEPLRESTTVEKGLRAVLQELLEPTGAIEAGMDIYREHDPEIDSPQETVCRIWQAMFDHILNEDNDGQV